jgi:hypothetical protein
MDWLILILGVPAVLIPLVLLFGFAGCGQVAGVCADDTDCPAGTRCVDGSCFVVGELPTPLPPENLAARALDDRSVSLTWINTDPAVTDFEIERTPENGEVDEVELIPAPDSPTGAIDEVGLEEGVTYIYRVRALLGEQRSEFSDTSSATVLPTAPVSLVARPASFDRIDLLWADTSEIATEFSLEHRVPGDAFAEIFRGPGTAFSHQNLDEGTQHEYQVFAIVLDGVENDVAQDVKSAASAIASATTFSVAFTAPPGTLTTLGNELPNVGFCLVQRLPQPFAAAGTQVRILLRGPNTGSLTLDRVTISQTADSQPGASGTEDPYDAASDLTDVDSNVTIAQNTVRNVGPANYTLDPTQDLLVAFDISNISNMPGDGNVRFGPLTGADAFSKPGTAEATVQDRAANYPNTAPDTLVLIEKILVL